jgi:hypothetical protein
MNLNGKQTIDSTDSWLRLNQAGDYGSGVYTPYVLRNDGEFINYGGIFGYNTVRGRKAQTNNNYTTAALWTESYDSTTTGIAFHISGNVGKFLEMRTDGVLYWENAKVWTANTDGSGSGLDADLLDGQHGSYYQPASTAITTGNIGSQSVSYADYTNRTYRGIIEDTRAAQRTPSGYDDYRVSWEFTDRITGIPDWHTVMTMQGWHDGYAAWQIIGPSSTTAHENWYLRSGNTTTWNTLRRIWHNGDFTSTNISNWNAAYNDRITAVSVTGAQTKTITLTQQDGGTLTATWTDYDTDNDAQTLSWDQGQTLLSISGGNDITLTGLATEDYVNSQGFVTSVQNLAIQTIGGDSGAFNVDTVSGQHGFVRFSTGAWAGTNPYPGNYSHILSINQSTVNGNRFVQMYLGDVPGALFWRMNQGGTIHPWERIWTSGNDGSGSGLDADLLDGQHGSYYAAASSLGSYLPLSGGVMSGNIDTSASIRFRDGAGTYSNIIRAAGYPSEGYDSSQTYWMEYRAYGGHHFVLNTDGGVGGGANNMDDFVIWQGAIDGDKLFELTNAGNLTIQGTFTESSSIRFKENIQPLEPALAKVEQLNPVTYTKITSQEEEIGLIAEEVAELFPEVVTYNEEGQPQGIQYQRLSVILLKAVQELTERVNKLENK